VIKRKTNRRHMTGDHHDRTARRATLLVTAADEILGTHRGSQAMGTGIAEWIGPNQTVVSGKEEPATVVAFNLGKCDGQVMYQAVEWYFPQHGQSFNPHQYENICTGTYAPG
jgi:hypothetical protein